ncbi:hypothetical protein BB14905_13845 [Bacillus sp. B14905]|nr:hypothetical protein BB14905_13845 [Bacillus sp. B14905]
MVLSVISQKFNEKNGPCFIQLVKFLLTIRMDMKHLLMLNF